MATGYKDRSKTMNIYKVNEDGGCAIQVLRKGREMPDGFAIVPPEMEDKPLYMVDGELTDQRPQAAIDEEALVFEHEEKIQAKMREVAITTLKASGDLPLDFVDRISPINLTFQEK
jgi:hypothetical protein